MHNSNHKESLQAKPTNQSVLYHFIVYLHSTIKFSFYQECNCVAMSTIRSLTQSEYKPQASLELRDELIREAHGGCFAGHLSEKKVYNRLRRYAWWRGMRADVQRHCRDVLFVWAGEEQEEWLNLLYTPYQWVDHSRELLLMCSSCLPLWTATAMW